MLYRSVFYLFENGSSKLDSSKIRGFMWHYVALCGIMHCSGGNKVRGALTNFIIIINRLTVGLARIFTL